jgi:hypothetical protein
VGEKDVLYTDTAEGTRYYYCDEPPRSAEVYPPEFPPDPSPARGPSWCVEMIAFLDDKGVPVPDDTHKVVAVAAGRDDAHRRALAWLMRGER